MLNIKNFIERDERGRFIKNDSWILPIMESFKDLNLKGIKTICPVCGDNGFIITRWVNGTKIKPIYILHFKKGKFEKICKIEDKDLFQIRSNAKILKNDIKDLVKKRKPYLLFSGGKDSIATLLYLNKIIENFDDLTIVHVDTTAGLQENTEYVKKICNYLNVRLEIVKPRVDYFTLAKEWGIPSFGFRWCCRELKIKPITEYFRDIKEPKVVFDGIRAVESNIRKQYIPIWYHPSFKCISASAIFHWSDEKVYSLINSNGLPKSNLNRIGTSTECWCGAYKTESDFKKLYLLNQDMYQRLAKLESDNKTGYTFLYNNGKKKTLYELENQILLSIET